ncbi:MAG: hypothetical protein LBT92_01505 [Rickettsiales bacterium]|jgi:hypothetical protein|nr:hypothetical protein [Rickettsiales bacterium]
MNEYQTLKSAGFSEGEIAAFMRPRLIDGGFSDMEVNQYFQDQSGKRPVSVMGSEQSEDIKEIANACRAEIDAAASEGVDLDWEDALKLGWQNSVAGMVKRGKLPDEYLSDNAGSLNVFERTLSGIAGLVADTPVFLAGGKAGAAGGAAAGAAAGSVIPGVGTAAGAAGGALVGGGAGAFGFHAAARQILVDAYQRGEVATAEELWERVKSAAGAGGKAAAVGALMGPVGKAAGAVSSVAGLGAKGATLVETAAQVGTMATAGPVIAEGRMPTQQDFIDSAFMVLGLKGAKMLTQKTVNVVKNTVLPKLMKEYVKTGQVPQEIMSEVVKDPVKAANLLSKNKDIDGRQVQERWDIRREYRDVKASPTGGDAYKVLVEMRPEEMKRMLVQKGAAIRNADGDLIVEGRQLLRETGTKSNFGFTKIIFKHGIGEKDAMKLPEFIRKYAPVEDTKQQQVWRVPINEKEHYTIVFNKGKLSEPGSTPTSLLQMGDTQQPGTTPAPSVAGSVSSIAETGKNVNENYLVSMYREPNAGSIPLSAPKARGTTPAEQEINSRISFDAAPKRTPKTIFTELKNKFLTAMVDRLRPLEIAVEKSGEKPSIENDPYKLARMYEGVSGKGDHFLERATFDFKTGKNNGRSFKSIIGSVKNVDEFRSYLVARRAVELSARSIRTGVPEASAKAVVLELEGKYAAAAAEIYAYQDRVLKYAVDSGRISQETYQAIKANNKYYVPFQREMDGPGGIFAGGGRNFKSKSPVRAIEGSERPIIDPFESIIKNTYDILASVEKNEVARALADLAGKPGMEGVIEKSNVSFRGQKVSKSQLKSKGIDIDDDFLDVKTPSPINEKNQIVAYRNGAREIYKVDPAIAKIINGLGPSSMGWVERVLSLPARTLRAGATLTPDFWVKNMARDMLQAFIVSKGSFKPGLDTAKGLKSSVAKDDAYWNWKKSGGSGSSMVSVDRKNLQKQFKALNETGYSGKVWNIVRHPMELLRLGSEIGEEATRLGIFKKRGAVAGTRGALLEAGMESRDITLDFARAGSAAKFINSYIPFFNAGIQGTAQFARAIRTRPAATALTIAGAIVVPSIYNAVANYGDKDIEEVPQAQKNTMWVFKAGDVIYRLPKPQQYGFIGTIVERMTTAALDGMSGRDRDGLFDGLFKAAMNEFQINFVPQMAVPFVERYANKTLFNDRPIIPYDREDALPEYQYTTSTNELTKAISAKIADWVEREDGTGRGATFSPAVAENFVREWTGALGQYMLDLADYAARKAGIVDDPVKPEKGIEDRPFVRAFMIRHPSRSAESLSKFYEHSKELDQYLKSFGIAKSELDAGAMGNLAIFQAYKVVDGIKQTISGVSRVIRTIENLPDMSSDDKRENIDALTLKMIDAARFGLETIKGIKKQVGEIRRRRKEEPWLAPAPAPEQRKITIGEYR